jgi:hypothetical protein
MPQFTSHLNLAKPGGGSSGLILPDETQDIDVLNANSDKIDAWAAQVDSRTVGLAKKGNTSSIDMNSHSSGSPTTLVSLSFVAKAGHSYLVIAHVLGMQVSTSGLPTVWFSVDDDHKGVLVGNVTYGVNQITSGDSQYRLDATTNGTHTALIAGYDSSSAFRVSANDAQLTVIDLGQLG